MNKTTALISAFILVGTTQVFAATSGASFLKIDHSARSFALGGNGVVTALGAESIGSNPGNLANLDRKMELLTSYTSVTEGVTYTHVAGAVNRSTTKNRMVDALGFSYTRLGVGSIEGRDSAGNKTADFDSADSQMSLSAGGNAGKLGLGITGKMVQSKIGEFKANTVFAFDMGASYSFKKFGRNMRTGLSITNLGQEIKYLNEQDPLPSAVHAALSTEIGFLNITGGMTQKLKESETLMNLGMELNLGAISLRAGANSLGGDAGSSSGIFEGFGSGVGMQLGIARMDYAVGQNNADLGLSHRLSLTLQFGKRSE